MAETEPTEAQQRQIWNLVAAIGQDSVLRDRLKAEPRVVFAEFGLAELLPKEMQFEVRVNEAEVGGFAGSTGHWDIAHADVGPTRPPYPTPHVDFAHTDLVALRGAQIQILPTIGPAR